MKIILNEKKVTPTPPEIDALRLATFSTRNPRKDEKSAAQCDFSVANVSSSTNSPNLQPTSVKQVTVEDGNHSERKEGELSDSDSINGYNEPNKESGFQHKSEEIVANATPQQQSYQQAYLDKKYAEEKLTRNLLSDLYRLSAAPDDIIEASSNMLINSTSPSFQQNKSFPTYKGVYPSTTYPIDQNTTFYSQLTSSQRDPPVESTMPAFSSVQYSTIQPSIVTTPSSTKEAYASRVSLNSSMNIVNSTQLPTSSPSKSQSGSIISNNQKQFLAPRDTIELSDGSDNERFNGLIKQVKRDIYHDSKLETEDEKRAQSDAKKKKEEKEHEIKRMNELIASKMEILKKKVGPSTSHSNIAYHYKRSPPQVLGQFRRAKSSSIFESFRDCKDKENTPPRMPNTPPRMSRYSSPSYSPLSDLSQSPLSSPLKRMAESPITQYFKRTDISKTMIKSTLAVSTPKKSGDVTTSSEDECDDDSVISSTPCNDSKKRRSTVSISDEVICSKIKETKNSSMLISPAPKLGAFKKEKVTVSASVGIRHGSKTHVTPPTKSGITGYFHKMKGKHKKVSRYITEDKLHDVSPETLRVFAAARGGDVSLFREYTMENVMY
ncbi:hypothetical protein F8M41_019771 [Gigaspora margarita]|uniref:Uncharacterized protein n=1 Tax=Gigaspora margarita TaxID=4874 RepID=A0A8H4AJG7_GIGMA|nr:hypothetical protein F8M41_019771 [Gigaspora margarita]